MAEEKHLVLFQIVSAGQNGAELGSDEEQIVYLLYAIHDVQHNKVKGFFFSRCILESFFFFFCNLSYDLMNQIVE
jgi:hypothetical protein